MGRDSEYITEEQRIRQRLRETLTPREKLAHWWTYHKIHVGIAALFLLGALYFALQERGIPDPDYTAAWVSGERLDEETAGAIARRLARYGEDLNGDGKVQVELRQINLDLGLIISRGGTEGQQEYGELLSLDSDLEVGQSGIFLTDDPASFQTYTGALLYRDGTQPEEKAEDWGNMVISWEQEGIGTVYAGLRGCWKDSWRETWETYREMWNRMAGVV